MKPLLIASMVAFVASPFSAQAKSFWQDPVAGTCEVGPGEDCVVDAKCPSWAVFAVIPSFSVTATEPSDARIGLLSMTPVQANAWQIVWRNQGDAPAKVETSVMLRCGKIKDWGQ